MYLGKAHHTGFMVLSATEFWLVRSCFRLDMLPAALLVYFICFVDGFFSVTCSQFFLVCAGNLQQQAAAAGALQALAYCPSRGPTYARTIAAHDALQPLVDMLERGPVPMCCAAAGALCNLALACPENQVGHGSINTAVQHLVIWSN